MAASRSALGASFLRLQRCFRETLGAAHCSCRLYTARSCYLLHRHFISTPINPIFPLTVAVANQFLISPSVTTKRLFALISNLPPLMCQELALSMLRSIPPKIIMHNHRFLLTTMTRKLNKCCPPNCPCERGYSSRYLHTRRSTQFQLKT